MSNKTWIVSAVVVVLLLAAYVFYRPAGDGLLPTSKPENKALLTLTRLRPYADSLGIDTTRFALSPEATPEQAEAKLQALLTEVRFGKKPSTFAYTGLKEQMDTTGVGAVTLGPSLMGWTTQSTTFAPYKQLLAHYNRMRGTASADTLRAIRQTLNFYRYLNRFGAERFVLVNIPAAELNVFDAKGDRLLTSNVIAGKKDKKTPTMTTFVSDIVAYPYWNVPKGIAVKEMLPKIKADQGYLDSQNLQVLDEREKEVDPGTVDWNSLSAENFPYRIRQTSGCHNSLGLLKFELSNPLAIYLHDTNGRDLFTESNDRFRSHGCVRVQKPVDLANNLLNKKVFDDGFMNRCLIDQKPQTLKLPQTVPVFIVYHLADVDAAGQLRMYPDVYGKQ